MTLVPILIVLFLFIITTIFNRRKKGHKNELLQQTMDHQRRMMEQTNLENNLREQNQFMEQQHRFMEQQNRDMHNHF